MGRSCCDGLDGAALNNVFDLAPSLFNGSHLNTERLHRNVTASGETLQRGFPIPVKPPNGDSSLLQLADEPNTCEREAPVNHGSPTPRNLVNELFSTCFQQLDQLQMLRGANARK